MYVEILTTIVAVVLLGLLHLYERRHARRPHTAAKRGCPPIFPFRDADAMAMPTFESTWRTGEKFRRMFDCAGESSEIPKLPLDERKEVLFENCSCQDESPS
jgi:hypothetical protein